MQIPTELPPGSLREEGRQQEKERLLGDFNSKSLFTARLRSHLGTDVSAVTALGAPDGPQGARGPGGGGAGPPRRQRGAERGPGPGAPGWDAPGKAFTERSVDLWGLTEMGMKAFTEGPGARVRVEVKVTGLGNQPKQDSIPRPLTTSEHVSQDLKTSFSSSEKQGGPSLSYRRREE